MYHNLKELLQQAEDHEVLLSEIVLHGNKTERAEPDQRGSGAGGRKPDGGYLHL